MTDPEPPASGTTDPDGPHGSDEPTLELILRGKAGDRAAIEALLERCLPPLRRWSRGKLPSYARSHLDTEDIVQDVAMQVVKNLDAFEPRHVGALQAYLRRAVVNRICDEVRRVGRRPPPLELPPDPPDHRTSPLEQAIKKQGYELYRDGLRHLRVDERRMVVARIEMQWSFSEIAHRFGRKSVDAALMSVTRAIQRLTNELRSTSSP